jgi:hypothetical protein
MLKAINVPSLTFRIIYATTSARISICVKQNALELTATAFAEPPASRYLAKKLKT